MGWWTERKRQKALGSAVGEFSMRGGTFRTVCPPDVVLSWLAESDRAEVISQDAAQVTAHPVFKSGDVGSEVVVLRAAPTTNGTVTAQLELQGITKDPNTLNMNALGPVSAVLKRLDDSDPDWWRR